MNNKFKKIAASVMAVMTLAVGMTGMSASAYKGTTTGHLRVSYHYVPILKDTARGTTCTNYAHVDSSYNLNKLWAQTTVYAYDKSGNYVKNTSKKAYASAALEGWNETEAVAKIKNIKKAKGTHKGGTTGYGYLTAYTNWNK